MAEYDNKINWKEFYSERLPKGWKINGDEIKSNCPFHNDKEPSFTANLKTGLYKCYGCDASGNGQKFLQEAEGLSGKDSFSKIRELAGEKEKKRKAYTVENYAEAKKLPVEFLKELGIRNSKVGITIPYLDESGAAVSTRQRYGESGTGPKFSWSRGSKVLLYGLWMLPKIRKSNEVVLVEGESDSQTLWYNEIPALGVPGATVFQVKWVEYLSSLKKIYLFDEGDSGGETFIRKASEALLKGNYKGKVYKITLLDYKDPSEMYCADPGKFKERWEANLIMAEEIDIKIASGSVEQSLPDAPVQLRQAPAFKFTPDGIFVTNEKTGLTSCLCKTPLLLHRRLKSLEDGQEKIEICFKRDGNWSYAVYPRSTIFQARTIPTLADLGITVTSENARYLVKFLSALEAENIDILESAVSVGQMGWHGKQFLPGCNGNLVLDVDPASQKWISSYHEEGTFEDWKETVLPFRKNSIFKFILGASFAAPLLLLLKERNFIVHNWGETRVGKTAALKAALSVWGDPDGLMATFFATPVGLERLAGFYKDLPLGIDERQVSSHPEGLNTLLYMLSGGYGKVRGSKGGGLQHTQSWRTIALTTGEEPLITEAAHSGMYSRIVEIYGPPFDNEEEAQAMHDLKSYGHAGPAFIKKIRDALPEILSKYKWYQNTIPKIVVDKDLLKTQVRAIQVITFADALASEWLFGESEKQAQGAAIDMAMEIAVDLMKKNEIDIAARACKVIEDWTMQYADRFDEDSPGEKYGFIHISNQKHYIIPTVLEEMLDKKGFSPKSAIQALRERGIIECRENPATGRLESKPAKFPGENRARRFHIIDLNSSDEDNDTEEDPYWD